MIAPHRVCLSSGDEVTDRKKRSVDSTRSIPFGITDQRQDRVIRLRVSTLVNVDAVSLYTFWTTDLQNEFTLTELQPMGASRRIADAGTGNFYY